MLGIIFDACTVVIVGRAILSWVDPRAQNPISRTLDTVLEPISRPIRRVLPATPGIDFSPMILLMGLFLIRGMLGV